LRGVTEPSAVDEIAYELVEAGRRRKPQRLKELPELPVVGERVGAITLHEEGPDEHAPAALAQRVCADRRRHAGDCRRHVAGLLVQLAAYTHSVDEIENDRVNGFYLPLPSSSLNAVSES